ncbi:DUF1294 domain-containing protein [Coprococcus comes]|uniref:DUF1294 domain-containing protein n=1 Tax=Coprococcus comes TaxID=410072 RepID=UPI0034A1E0CF
MIKIILLAYLLLINIITYFTYAADKTKARQNKWRIPERTLILLALLGGSPAALLAMKHYHHKTRHLSQPPSHHPSPTHFFRKSSESLMQYYIDSLYYITYNMLNKTI